MAPQIWQIGVGNWYVSPPSVTVRAGDTVVWLIETGQHQLVSGTPDAPDGLWDSGKLLPANTFAIEFLVPGTYRYFDMEWEGGGPSPVFEVLVTS